jgi:hypothetical protein
LNWKAGINSVFWKFAKDFLVFLVTFDTLPAQSCLTDLRDVSAGFSSGSKRIEIRQQTKEGSPKGPKPNSGEPL